nr:hypothetical protein [Pseudobutyrivibrio sp.]
MIQETFRFKRFNELKYIVDDIINSSKYHKAASIRMYIANPRVDMDEVQMVDFLNNFCPKA